MGGQVIPGNNLSLRACLLVGIKHYKSTIRIRIIHIHQIYDNIVNFSIKNQNGGICLLLALVVGLCRVSALF